MPDRFEIVVTGTAHEIYRCDAYDEHDARKQFENGQLTRPLSSEVEGAEIVEIRKLP